MRKPKKFAVPGKPARPLIEPLEARIAPAVTAVLNGGPLIITLGAANDSASISLASATITVSGTGFTTTQFTGMSAVQINFDANNQSVALGSTLSNILSAGFSVHTATSSITGASIIDTAGTNVLDVSGFTGTGSLSNSGSAPDEISATKSASFVLTNSLLTATDGMSLGLTDVNYASLTDTGGNHSFTVSGWTGGGYLTAPGAQSLAADTIVAVKAGGFNIQSEVMDSADSMYLYFSGKINLNLTDAGAGHGGNTFTLGSFRSVATLTNDESSPDKFEASEVGGTYVLTNTSYTNNYGASYTLAGAQGFSYAAIYDSGGGNTFNVSGWTGSGTLYNSSADLPGYDDFVTASKSANFTLTNTSLSSSDGMNMTLYGVTEATLTDTGGGHSFTVGGWTGTGSLIQYRQPDRYGHRREEREPYAKQYRLEQQRWDEPHTVGNWHCRSDRYRRP
jgi:hypothetical protein